MSTFSKHLFAALMGAAILSSCSRPVAYFQPSAREQFRAPKTETVAVATPAEATQPAVAEALTPEAAPQPAEQIVQAKQVMSQVEAYVRNDSKLSSNRKLAKRMTRVNELLATADERTTAVTKVTSSRKMTLMERAMLKKIDKKIKNHVAPDQTNAMTKNLKTGIILGGVGLLLALFFGGILGILGLILLIVGIVLILLGVLE